MPALKIITTSNISRFTFPHKIGISLLAAGMIFDILTTTAALSRGASEGNPFMISLVTDPIAHALIKVMDLLVILMVLLALHKNFQLSPKLVILPYITTASLFVLVSLNNLRFI